MFEVVTDNKKSNLSHNAGGTTGRRLKIGFSNFPLDIENKFFNKIYIENNITSFKPNSYSLELKEDIFPGGYRQLIPTDVLEFGSKDNAITFTVNLDPYKRNYFMFLILVMNTIKKCKNYAIEQFDNTPNVYENALDGDDANYNDDYADRSNNIPIDTLNDLKIDRITVDLCDDVGNPHTLISLVYENCFVNSLSELELNPHTTDQQFSVGLLYETFRIDTSRMEILNKLEQTV